LELNKQKKNKIEISRLRGKGGGREPENIEKKTENVFFFLHS